MNNGVLDFLDYVIYIMVLSVLVSIFNPNHTGMYLPLLVSGLNAWTVLFFVHEEYTGTVDMTSHVGIIPIGLASCFLV